MLDILLTQTLPDYFDEVTLGLKWQHVSERIILAKLAKLINNLRQEDRQPFPGPTALVTSSVSTWSRSRTSLVAWTAGSTVSVGEPDFSLLARLAETTTEPQRMSGTRMFRHGIGYLAA